MQKIFLKKQQNDGCLLKILEVNDGSVVTEQRM